MIAAPTAAQAATSERQTLLASPMKTTFLPSSEPRHCRIVKRSPSAWVGCSTFESRLTTGTGIPAAPSAATNWVSVWWSATRAAMSAW